MNDPRRILITGGAGYGTVVLDDLSSGLRQALPDDVAFIEGDAGTAYPVSQC